MEIINDINECLKETTNKPELQLIPFDTLEELSKVLEYSIKKKTHCKKLTENYIKVHY